MNVDPAEMAHFSDLARVWWDPRGKLKTLHAMNPPRLDFIDRTAKLKDKTVLDVGCGGGLLTEAMARRYARVTGIDVSSELISVAREHAARNGLDIDYHTCSIEEYSPSGDKKFDLITCMELLEHVPDPVSVIECMARRLSPGGHLILSTINRSFRSYCSMILGAEYLLRILPVNTHQYARFIRPSELYAWLRGAGLVPDELAGINYIPVLDYASLTDSPSVNYIVHAGLRA